MSGSSWEYFCYKLDEVAERLIKCKSLKRRAFGRHMQLCATAMHDIEWVDSGDLGEGDENEAISKAMGNVLTSKELIEANRELKELRDALSAILNKEAAK